MKLRRKNNIEELKIERSNKVAIVDDHNFERLNVFKWYSCGRGGHVYRMLDSYKWESLPNTIFGKDGMYDHKDRNPFNNIESNLRPTDYGLNNANRTKIKLIWHLKIQRSNVALKKNKTMAS